MAALPRARGGRRHRPAHAGRGAGRRAPADRGARHHRAGLHRPRRCARRPTPSPDPVKLMARALLALKAEGGLGPRDIVAPSGGRQRQVPRLPARHRGQRRPTAPPARRASGGCATSCRRRCGSCCPSPARCPPSACGHAFLYRDPMLRTERSLHRALDEAMFQTLREHTAESDRRVQGLEEIVAGGVVTLFQPILDLRGPHAGRTRGVQPRPGRRPLRGRRAPVRAGRALRAPAGAGAAVPAALAALGTPAPAPRREAVPQHVGPRAARRGRGRRDVRPAGGRGRPRARRRRARDHGRLLDGGAPPLPACRSPTEAGGVQGRDRRHGGRLRQPAGAGGDGARLPEVRRVAGAAARAQPHPAQPAGDAGRSWRRRSRRA